jgi:CDP-6-deoxy-D-xylo-4-hexulose-3-dehydrase
MTRPARTMRPGTGQVRWSRLGCMTDQTSRRIDYAGSVHDEREIAAVVEVLRGGPTALRIGRNVREMERRVAELLGKRRGVMCNSGSSALYLAIEVLDLEPGDEIVTSAVTFSTDVAPMLKKGVIPAFVDVTPDTFQIDVERIEEMIGPRARAILAPDLIGNCPDWDAIRSIADRHDLTVIEDSCDALGQTLRGTPTGLRADIALTSFALSHIITAAGTGGMVCFDDDELVDRALLLRRWGRRSEVQLFGSTKGVERRFFSAIEGADGADDLEYDNLFIFDEVGWNFEPSELSAAFGLVQPREPGPPAAELRADPDPLRPVPGALRPAEAHPRGGDGLAHVPVPHPGRVGHPPCRPPAVDGGAGHRHPHGVDRQRHPPTRLPPRGVPHAGDRPPQR